MKKSNILVIIGLIAIIIAIFLHVYNVYEELNASKKSIEILNKMKINLDEENINEYSLTLNIDGNEYIGIISIPSLNIELPVMNNYEHLNIAPGRYYGSVKTNDLIICAHSYKKHFKYIGNLNQGDIVKFIDINNIEHTYEVLEIEILSPNDILEMIENDFDLTLYTCTSDGLNRITVRCNKK